MAEKSSSAEDQNFKNIILNDIYIPVKKISQGAFGIVYYGVNTENG